MTTNRDRKYFVKASRDPAQPLAIPRLKRKLPADEAVLHQLVSFFSMYSTDQTIFLLLTIY